MCTDNGNLAVPLLRFDLETKPIVMFSAERNVKSFLSFKKGQSLAVKVRQHETNRPIGVQDRGRHWRGLRSARCRASWRKEHISPTSQKASSAIVCQQNSVYFEWFR